jgi:ElaB/YqjD/DUF883 family membrane-anchored ribosome-binding protein
MITEENKSSREMERDVEQTRARMTETLDELRARMSPGQMLDEVLGYARDSGGGKMIQNLGRTIQENPAPLLVIGAGIAWMMTAHGTNRSEAPWHGEPRAEVSPPNSEGEGSVLSDAASAVAETARRAGEQVADTIGSLTGTATEAAAGVRERASRSMHDIRDGVQQARRSTSNLSVDAMDRLTGLFQEQPLVFGALGLALGAALGAALPQTESEDKLMGGASDAVKEGVSSVATAGYAKAKAVVGEVIETASSEAESQGITKDTVKDLARDLSSKAGAVLETAKEAAIDEADRQGLTGNSGQTRRQNEKQVSPIGNEVD